MLGKAKMKKLAPTLKLINKTIIGALFVGVIVGGALSSQRAFAANETLYVNSYTEVTRQWTEFGDSPWLNESDANYIYTKNDEDWHDEFTFADPSGSGTLTINSVKVYFELKIVDISRSDSVEVYIHDGSTWSDKLGDIIPSSDSYYWENVDISGTLDTWPKITAAKLRVKYDKTGSPQTAEIYIRQAYLYIDHATPTTILGDGTDPSDSTVAPGSINNYLDQFTFVTEIGTDSITDLTVHTTNTGAIASMEIWNDVMGEQYFATLTMADGNAWNFSGGTPISVTTAASDYRIIFDAKSHASLAEGSYPVIGMVTSFTSDKAQSGSDTSATITIDNSPPASGNIENWIALPSIVNESIGFGTTVATSVAYGNGKFVVVGDDGKASYSSNGETWNKLTPGEDTGIKFGDTIYDCARSVAYGNGKFVVVGDSGKASYSDDGITWEKLDPGEGTGIKFGTDSDARSVAYCNDRFIVVGHDGKASYSSGGETWEKLDPGEDTGIRFGTSDAYSVTYGSNKFVVVGDDGKASYSLNGIDWNKLTPGGDTGIKFGISYAYAYSVVYGSDKFVVVGGLGKASYSFDGVDWNILTPGEDTGIRFGETTAYSVTYGNGRFVAVGLEGKASYSSDGVDWNILTPGEDTGIRFGTIQTAFSVAYCSGKFVVVGSSGKASYSFDGINWFSLDPGADAGIKFGIDNVRSVAYGNDKFVAVGVDGKASYSSNGIDWTPLDIKFGTDHAFSVAYGSDKFVVVGEVGHASYSFDGVDWTPMDTKFGDTRARSVTYGNGKFVVVGDFGYASYSLNGIDWTFLTPGADTGIKFGDTMYDHAFSVAYVSDKFVVVGRSGHASYSSDGIDWNKLDPGEDTGIKFGTNYAYSVTYGNGKFVVVGDLGKASYSSNGIDWNKLDPGEDTGIEFGTDYAYSVIYDNGKFVAVGGLGKASYSSDGVNWTSLTPGEDTGIRFGDTFALSVAYGNGKFVAVGGFGGASYCFYPIWVWGGISRGNEYIELNWTNPQESDFYQVLILRNTSPITDAPTDGETYDTVENNIIGSSTVCYVGSGTDTTDTGLDNESDYFYKIFPYDIYGNYASGAEIGITPTAVGLVDFYAIGADSKVILRWKTATEMNNLGFNIYRSSNKSSGYTKINASLIAGQGTSAMGHEYEFIDDGVTNGTTYYYILEDVDYDGTTKKHGPVVAHPGLDSDLDGMSDDYERHFGLDPNDPSDAELDPDGDGRTNLEEYLDLTDPTRAESAFLDEQEEITIIEQGEDYIILELNTSILESKDITIGGQTYQEVWLPEYIHSYTQTPGQPMLPEKGVLVGTKTFNQASLEVLDSEYESYLNYNIYPQSRYIQEEDPDTGISWIKRQFYKDEIAYYQDDFFPGALTDIDYSYYLRDQKIINLRFYPLQYNPYTDELRFYTRIRIRVDFSTVSESTPSFDIPDDLYKSGSIKLFIRDEGMYKLTKDYLEAQGIDTFLINPQSLRIFNQGKEVPIRVEGGDDGHLDSGDYIEFYAQEIDSAYTDKNIYWLALSIADESANYNNEALLIESENEPEASSFLSLASFSHYEHIERDEDYWMNVEEETDPWFFAKYLRATSLKSASKTYTFDIENLLASFPEAELSLSLYGLSFGMDALGHHAYIYLNNYFIGEESWQGDKEHIFSIQFPSYYLLEGENSLTIELPGGLSQLFELAVLNYIDISYPKKLTAENNQIIFSPKVKGAYEVNIEGFTDSNIEIFKIEDELTIKRIDSFSISSGATYSVTFKDIAELSDKYIVLAESAYKTPENILADTPSNLTSPANQADYIIITTEGFSSAIRELADYRAYQGLVVKTVKIQDIYDEFNYGIPRPEALRDFLSFAYNRWSKPAPKYVLLVGDATFDYRDIYGFGSFEYIPTHFVYNPLFGWTADDSYFVCLDSEDDLLSDMLIGRLPVKTTNELCDIIDKIKSYEALDEDEISWAKTATFVADKTDDNNFPTITDSLASYLPDDFAARKLYYDNYLSAQPIKYDIIDSINDGSLLFTYSGHGGVQLISRYRLFQNSDIDSLFNSERYPFMVMLTCANGYFVFPRYFECLGEELIKAGDKGAIAVLASSGATYSIKQIHLGRGLYKAIFEDDDYVLGSVVAQAKVYLYNQVGEEGKYVSKTFNLFGDPALRLKGYDAAQEKREEEVSTQDEPAAFNLIVTDDIVEVINNESTVDLTEYDIILLGNALAGLEVGESTYEYTEETITKPVLLNLMNKITRKISKQESKPKIEKQEPVAEKGPEPSVLAPSKEKITVKPKTLELEEIESLEIAERREDIIDLKPEKQQEKEVTQRQKSVWQKLKEIIINIIITIFHRIKTLFAR